MVKHSVEHGEHSEIKVVNICDLLDVVRPNWLKDFDYERESASVMGWCRENGAHYYAAPREDFSKYVAVREAEEAGKGIVVVEDLS